MKALIPGHKDKRREFLPFTTRFNPFPYKVSLPNTTSCIISTLLLLLSPPVCGFALKSVLFKMASSNELSYKAGEISGQAQVHKDHIVNKASEACHSAADSCQESKEHAAGIVQQTVEQVKSTAQGAAEAVMSTAQGAAGAMKSTLGIGADNTTATNSSSNITSNH